jgi:hypothetical protein
MNILLWILQVLVAAQSAAGAVWILKNYEEQKDFVGVKILSQGTWNIVSALEILFALGLIVPGIAKALKIFTPISAVCLAIVFLIIFVLQVNASAGGAAYWAIAPVILLIFIAYGRFVLKPL